MTAPHVTHTSTVTEEQIDHLGHMNVRYYAVNANAGTEALIRELAGPGVRYAVDDVYTRHHREQLLGTPLEIRSAVLTAEADRLRIHHELRASDTDTLAATFVHGVTRLDDGGGVTAWPGQVVEVGAAVSVDTPDYAATRTISLDADLMAAAPTLDDVMARGLAMRKPRPVGADECDDEGVYRPDVAPMLTWGGEPVDGQQNGGLHETGDGKLLAWASMETRLIVDRWPRIGDRIQSFGAGIQIFDKVTHRIHWAFDLDTGRLLTAFEAVSMAFDVRERRPMSIPAGYREREMANLQPDLAPRTLV